jgi:hypothetical protein
MNPYLHGIQFQRFQTRTFEDVGAVGHGLATALAVLAPFNVKAPMWPDSLRRKILQPAARSVGIAAQVGWHTFRHTYSSLLADTGNDVRVVQELMRHAKLSTTMEVYTHARMEKNVWPRKKLSMCCWQGNRDSSRLREVSVPICSHGSFIVPGFWTEVIEKNGGPGRDRTDDLFHAMEARSQLRHRPTKEPFYSR